LTIKILIVRQVFIRDKFVPKLWYNFEVNACSLVQYFILLSVRNIA
jgi:hypothetical protein